MANAKAPAGFRNVSRPGVEAYQTEDGNVTIQRVTSRTWVVMPRGRDNFYSLGRPTAASAALTIAAEIGAVPDRLFIGTFATGISYADRSREKNGDYLRLAFLSFSTLALTWTPGVTVPDDLRAAIESDARAIQSRRGEAFQVSTAGQTVTLGKV